MSILDGGNASSTFDSVPQGYVDIVEDVQTYLQASPNVQELVVAPLVGKDEAWVNGWIFDSALSVTIENSQRCAIVVSYGGGWTSPVDDSSAEFPVVVVDIWADPTRREDNSVKENDAKTKCFQVHAAVRRALHISTFRDYNNSPSIYFGNTRVVSSELLGEPDLQWVSDGNGARMLRARYGITTF